MCRLAFIERPFKGLETWLKQLERSAGGNGNGVAVGRQVLKGIKLSVVATVAAMHNLQPPRRGRKRPLPALWHTRRTSSGNSVDQLCHPHRCAGGWLAHNGHWSIAHTEAMKLTGRGPMSDTRFFSLLVQHRGFLKAAREFRPPGVWLHMRDNGSLAAWKSGGSLWHCPELGAWGSEPATMGAWHRVADGEYGYGDAPAREPNECVDDLWDWEEACLAEFDYDLLY